MIGRLDRVSHGMGERSFCYIFRETILRRPVSEARPEAVCGCHSTCDVAGHLLIAQKLGQRHVTHRRVFPRRENQALTSRGLFQLLFEYLDAASS